jgi:hypothetical protein
VVEIKPLALLVHVTDARKRSRVSNLSVKEFIKIKKK